MYDWMPDPPRAWRSAEKDEAGPDGITNEMLKHLGPGAKRTLLRIYNQSWSTGTVPTIWKEAVIRPIPKKGKDKRDPSSYRPISVLSCVGKLLERIISKRLIWHLQSNSVLASAQTSYRQFRSTEEQLALLPQDIEDAFQEKKVLAVFFDLSEAFDKVWKEGLLLKLLRAGVHGKMYKWLFNRTARVKLDGTISRQVKLREGVPQGIAYSLPGLHKWHHNHSAKTCVKHPACRWLCSMVRWRTYHHSCPSDPEYHQRGVQLDWELDTTAQHNQDGQHTLHTVHRKGESLTKIRQPASSTGWDANVSWGNPRYTLDVETTPWSSWSQGHQKTGHHEETCRNHLEGQLRHPETGLNKGCKTSRRVCLHNLGYCLKNQQKQARHSAEHGPENYLRCYEKHTNPTNGKDYRPSTFGVQTWVQSCHPRGKAEETDQSSTPPETSAWNQKPPEKKELQAQVEGPTKRKCWSSGGRSRKMWGTHNGVWASRKSLPEVRTEIPGLAAKGTQTPELQKALTLEMIQSCYPKSTWTHVFTDGSVENALRNGGSGAYICRPDGTTSSLSIPAGDLSSNYRAEVHTLKAATELLIEEDCNHRISSSCLTPCLLFSLWQMAPPTFAPSSYTKACVLYQTTAE